MFQYPENGYGRRNRRARASLYAFSRIYGLECFPAFEDVDGGNEDSGGFVAVLGKSGATAYFDTGLYTRRIEIRWDL